MRFLTFAREVGIFTLIGALLVGIILAGCEKKKEEPTQPPVGENYIPYKVGNFWEYQVTEAETTFTIRQSVIGETAIGGKTVMIVEQRDSRYPDDWTRTYFEVTTDAVLMHGLEEYDSSQGDTTGFFFDPALRWAQIPFETGQSWTVLQFAGKPSEFFLLGDDALPDDINGDGVDDTIELAISGTVEAEETVQAAGETFQAFKVGYVGQGVIHLTGVMDIPLQMSISTIWFAPFKGIVKLVEYDPETGATSSEWILTSYYVSP